MLGDQIIPEEPPRAHIQREALLGRRAAVELAEISTPGGGCKIACRSKHWPRRTCWLRVMWMVLVCTMGMMHMRPWTRGGCLAPVTTFRDAVVATQEGLVQKVMV